MRFRIVIETYVTATDEADGIAVGRAMLRRPWLDDSSVTVRVEPLTEAEFQGMVVQTKEKRA